MRTVGELVGQMRDGAREVLSLAFFYFAAIAAERLFVSRVAIFVGADAPAVLPLTAAIVLAAIVGFLLRPYLVYRFADDHGRRVTSDVMGTLAVAAPVVVIMARQFAAMLAGSLVAACALGYAGSAAHAGMARKFGRSSGLPHAISVAYAVGVTMQLVNNVVVPGEVPSQFLFMVVDIAMIAMLHEQGDRWAATRRARAAAGIEPDADRHAGDDDRWLAGQLMLATACLAAMFGLLDGLLVAGGASGLLGLGTGARLLLAVSVLAAGALCGVRARTLYAAAPGLAGAAAVAGLVALVAGATSGLSVALLCAGSGFLVVFFTAAFMRLAPRMHMAELWPVMGCAVAYGAGIVGVLAGAPLASLTGAPVVAAVMLVLLVGAGFALHGCASLALRGEQVPQKAGSAVGSVCSEAGPVDSYAPEARNTAASKVDAHGPAVALDPGARATDAGSDGGEPELSADADCGEPASAADVNVSDAEAPGGPAFRESLADRVARFGEENGLTPREREILSELLISDDSMQEVAGRLYLSRSTLYRHIATMSRKTGASSRAGLIKSFWLWDERR